MNKRDRTLVLMAIAPNAVFVIGLMSAIAWRTSSGLPPMPAGAAPWIIGISACFPIASVGLVNILRLRRDA